ncbi:ABC transporter ATP-binding protein [Sulfoacidibacillus thermotolerans]|uniref:Multidrug ABC transporter ATP-binding protein n=1 Tax=Sulfoacidibacillus thermotolerans TaxID=1765684 RepID=A0A2U3D685_SULT2|nr:ABC transporter ATP-binding protein [Sulfoacidibacillus thermotolerans]PWI56791.1 multidrug ABC transporter ATP-binding protein [Sulfoacidibacillus thermotolerans]
MKKLFPYFKTFRVAVAVELMLIFLQSLSMLYLPNLMSDMVDQGILHADTSYILQIGGWMLFVSFLGMGCSVLASLVAARVSAGFGKILRQEVFSHVEALSLQGFDQLGTSSLITRTTNDITQVQRFVNMALRMMVMAPMTAIGGILMAVSTDAQLSWILLVAIPLLTLILFFTLRKGIRLFQIMQRKIDQIHRIVRENLSGIRVIRSFNRVAYERKRFEKANRELTDTAIAVNHIMAALMPSMMLIMNFSTIAILWFGGIRLNNGQMQIGSLMAFIQYVMQILFSVMMVSMMFFMIPRASASAARVNEVLELTPEVQDDNGVQRGEQGVFSQDALEIEFQKVSFRYPGAEQPAVEDISFRVKPGGITAIIGGTGSGKSTLLHLLLRFYEEDTGKILVGGIDVREWPRQELRARIGFVPQKSILFSGSVEENIRYGNNDASDDEVWRAARIAQATDFIAAMKNGLQSHIAERGANVSGGQKQRLAIARALVKKVPIYLFDDSFSALDLKTDAQLRAALKKEVRDATVLLVAQRVSTVMDADQIIVLDNGKIAGIGTHEQLLETSAIYQEIVNSQLAEGEIA